MPSVRLLADCEAHIELPQPLITPYSMLPMDVQGALANKNVLDFGLNVQPDNFTFEDTHCTIPTSLVVAYAMLPPALAKLNAFSWLASMGILAKTREMLIPTSF